MKKFVLVSLIIIQSSWCMAFAQYCCENDSTFSPIIERFPIIERRIMQLYENEVFYTASDPDFKMSDICTADFIKRLESANEYDGGGYATWLLRSGMQDGDDTPSRVISVVPGKDNTVIVHWSDMGHKGSTTFTMTEAAGEWKISSATVPEGHIKLAP